MRNALQEGDLCRAILIFPFGDFDRNSGTPVPYLLHFFQGLAQENEATFLDAPVSTRRLRRPSKHFRRPRNGRSSLARSPFFEIAS